ncbi:MAG: adenylate/guanylate cyclase domain-containing protein [Candidatus Aminicenantes bacterium]|nr:adenylate/guanylate cyclase domain-containing protein [Candidatus Aminicenantes bacterium]
MNAHLVIEQPGLEPVRLELGNTTGIGRSSTNQVCLKDDSSVSRQHALIRRQGESEYSVIDLGSANGTCLNGKLVLGPTVLRPGDLIRVGETTLRFEMEGAAPDAVSPEQTVYERTMMAVRMSTMVVLVCDIRRFTRIGEILPPDQLSRFLGSWFRQTSGEITSRGGVVDKFIGDAVMAYWPVESGKAEAAAESAVEAAKAIHALARTVEVPGHPRFEFQVGVGLNLGLVSSGNIGMQSQRDMTIMGDAVTLAFRLEGVCKVKKMPIVAGAEFAKSLASRYAFIPLGKVKLKGKTTSPEAFGLALE